MASSSLSSRAAALVVPCILFACGGDDSKSGVHPEADADASASHADAATSAGEGRKDGGDLGRPGSEMDSGNTNASMDGAMPGAADSPDGGSPVQSDAQSNAQGDAQAPTASSDPDQPWQLDCAHLPANGVCQGGPHEVLLVSTDEGDVIMLDPQDGHYVGVLKSANQDPSFTDNGYQLATQGPDQCIWTVSGDDSEDTVRAVERWNTDGSFRDDIIPRGKYQRNSLDRLKNARTLAFGPDFVLVSSGEADRDNQQVSRYTLDGNFDRELFPGRVESLLVLGDGSLLSSGEKLQRWPHIDGTPSTVLTESTYQLAYAGNGNLYTSDFVDPTLYRVHLDNGNAATFANLAQGDDTLYGVAVLGNGKVLYTDDSSDGPSAIYLFDPNQPTSPRGEPVYSASSSNRSAAPVFTRFGRACLPEAVVSRVPASATEVSADHCDDVPPGTALVQEDFEQDDFAGVGPAHAYHGWTDVGKDQTPPSELTSNEHVSGHRALKVYANPSGFTYHGIAHPFASAKPSYIGYYQKVDTAANVYAKLALLGTGTLEEIFVNDDGLGTAQSTVQTPLQSDSWVRIQLRNIDWNNLTYDLYVDCKRVGSGLWLEPDLGKTLQSVTMFAIPQDQDVASAAYYDDIVIK